MVIQQYCNPVTLLKRVSAQGGFEMSWEKHQLMWGYFGRLSGRDKWVRRAGWSEEGIWAWRGEGTENFQEEL